MSASARSAGEGDMGEMLEPGGSGFEPDTLEESPGRYEDNRTVLDYFNEETGYEGDGSTRVKLAEIAAGSEEEAFYAFSGLNTFLKKNGFADSDEFEDIVIGGGMQLDDPHRWGKRWEGYMREFKNDPYDEELPEPDRLDAVLRAADGGNFEDEDHIGGEYEVKELLQRAIDNNEEELRGQLESGSAHRRYVRERMAEMLDGVDVDIHYGMGEEERGFNRKQEAENLVDRLATRLDTYKEKKEDEREELEEEKESELQALEELEPVLDTAKTLYQRVQGYYNGHQGNVSQEELRERKEQVFEEEEQLLEGLDSAYRNEIEEIFSFEDQGFDEFEGEYRGLVNDYEGDLEAREELIDSYIGDIDDVERDLSSIRREGSSEIFDLTNRATLSNFDAKALNFAAMEYIREDLKDKIPESHRDRTELHEYEQALIEADDESEFDDLVLGHNFMMGDTPSKYQLKRAEGAAERDYRQLDKDTEEMPDDYTVVDGAGGLRYTRSDITGMHTEEGQDVDSYEVSMMTLPMFQSQDAIIDGVKKGKKNQNTKRAKKDEMGDTVTTGAVIQTRLEDGSEVPLFLGEDSLTDLGMMTKKLARSEELTEEDYAELEGGLNHDFGEYWDEDEFEGLEDYVESFCALEPGAMVANADWHMGSEENDIGQPSKREKVWKMIDYETGIYVDARENGTPVGWIGSELVDGDQAWYGAENVNPGVSPHKMRERGSQLFEDTELGEISEELEELERYAEEAEPAEGFYLEKRNELQEAFMDEFMEFHDDYTDLLIRNMEKTPTPGIENQYEALEPYMPPIMDMASTIILDSGNHISSRQGDDEARRLDDKFKAVAFDEGFAGDLNIEKFTSNGDSGGGFGGKTDEGDLFPELEEGTGKLFGFEHETRSAKHRLLKLKREYLKSRNYYDEAFYHHVHKNGAVVMGDGTALTVTSSPKNEGNRSQRGNYSSSNWGVETKLFNAAEQSDPANDFNWHAWHFTGPETLNSDEFGGDQLDEQMEGLRKAANS